MPYIPENIDTKLLKKILDASYTLGGKYIALWPYPNVNNQSLAKLKDTFKPFLIERRKLELITTYNEEDVESMTEIYTLNRKSIKVLVSKYSLLVELLDNVAIYDSEHNWLAYSIFHESISAIRNGLKVRNIFNKNKVKFANNTPEGW